MVEESFEHSMSMSFPARRHGVAPNQLFTWRPVGDGLQSRAQDWTIIALGLTTGLLLIAPVWRASLRVGIDHNEGWNAALAARLMSGKPLYPAFDALSANNYPPLSFYAAGWLGRWLGDYLFAGRILALIGLFTSAVAVAVIVKWLTGRSHTALMSGLFLLGYSAALCPRYVGMDDPQWLGHGIMLLGLATFLVSKQRGWFFLLSAGFMLAAGFVKHILMPIPLAATLWLMLYRRDVLVLWLTTCVVLLASALALCVAIYGSDFFEGVFRDVRDWSLGAAYATSRHWFFWTALPLLLTGTLLLPSVWRCPEGCFVVIYAGFSAALAAYVFGGAGVSMNAIFDLEIALCLIVGIGIGQLDDTSRSTPRGIMVHYGPRPQPAAWWGLLLVVILAFYLPRSLLSARALWEHGRALEAAAAGEIDFLAKQSGAVACEDLSLCYWAGKGFEIDFFLTGQKLSRGLIKPRIVTERLRSRYYAAIQTDSIDGKSPSLPPGINREIEDNYEVVWTTLSAVLTPRPR
jgi:hypothetical protein